jgi:hypothetical protein
MGDLTRIEIEPDVAEMAASRAEEEGLTVTAYVSLLLRRSFERAPGEDSVLVYDHVADSGESASTASPTKTMRAIAVALRSMVTSSAAAADASPRRLRPVQFSFS